MLIASLNRLKGRFLCTLVSGCSCTVDPVVFGAAAENGGVRGHMIWADPDLRAVSADELSGEKELVHLYVTCQGGWTLLLPLEVVLVGKALVSQWLQS